MKIVLKIDLFFKKFLCLLNTKKYIHSKRVSHYSLEYYNYALLMQTKMPIEEVRKQKQKINLLSIYISPPELRKIHNRINKSLQKR